VAPGIDWSRYQAVLFDLDGVLTDTARLHSTAWKATFDDYLRVRAESTGELFVPFDIESDYRSYVDGRPRFEGVDGFLRSRGIALPRGAPTDPAGHATVCAIGNLKNELVAEMLDERGVDVYPGSLDLLNELRGLGIPMAVVTSSANASAVLARAELTGVFDAQVDGAVAAALGLRGKPHPDPFLEAARRLGVEPERAVVVEDAISGVRAGKDGGFGLVIGVDRHGDAESLRTSGADVVVTDLGELTGSTGRMRPDPWILEVEGLDPDRIGWQETMFALSNGHLGVRGSFEQGIPHYQPGTLVNGFHETWSIEYPEAAYGYATTGQTIVYAPDATGLAVLGTGGPLSLDHAAVIRRLDLRRGTLTTIARWPELEVSWERLVSLTRREILAQRVTVEGHREGPVPVIESGWRNRQDLDYLTGTGSGFDPRRAASFGRRVLEPGALQVEAPAISTAFTTPRSGMSLSLAIDHHPGPDLSRSEDLAADSFELPVTAWAVEKRAAYVLSPDPADARALLAKAPGFADLAAEQARELEGFWNRAGVEIGADPALQQAVNWILFQLHQASVLIDGTGIPAKALSGQAYEGHYFWDTDVFVLPFVAHHDPRAAAALIRFRHSLLPAARRRARVLSQKGALYPWRTINGEEASAYYEAGTAQYHIDAAVVYGVDAYLKATGDDQILWNYGVEIAIETARMWVDLGFYDGGEFHIHTVTGPDEYSALVDDNAYTNHLARFNLRRAVTWTRRMEAEQPEAFTALAERIELSPAETSEWERAADSMHIPFDAAKGITPQDARFLQREPWDWTTPRDRYPLLLHFHPLVIYRHQVLKQADVVMAMFLLPDDFDEQVAQANFDYYDPITTGDSSLSPPIQAAVAARLERADKAMTYFRRAVLLDLTDLAHNTADGVHLATAGGAWQALVGGFGGLSWKEGGPTLVPRLPAEWAFLRFAVSIRGSRLRVHVQPGEVTLQVEEGEPVDIEVWGVQHLVGREPIRVAR
jgi:alpha,alpha-trehalose phosphorylase